MQPVVSDDSDPFADLDSDMNDDIQASELSSLICQLQSGEDCCKPSELVLAENELPVCSQFADGTGRNNLWLSLVPTVAKILLLMKRAKMKTIVKIFHTYLSLLGKVSKWVVSKTFSTSQNTKVVQLRPLVHSH